jgi:methionyl-tRNA synthetase
MSKSLGNVIDPFAQIAEFGVDPVRYYFLREVSFGQDGDWGREKFVNRNNADLANNFGNLAQRSLSMIGRTFGGEMPPRQRGSGEDNKVVAETIAAVSRMEEAMLTEQLHEAAAELIAALSAANLYFAEQAPWAKKDDLERVGAILATTADVVRRCAIAAQPFVPAAAGRMLDLLAVPEGERLLQHALDPDLIVPAGTKLPAPTPVFRKFEQAGAG